MNQSNVRPGEMKSDEMKAFNDFVKVNINSVWYKFNGINVSAYASPDGETDKNENLAKDRAKSGSVAVMSEFSKNKNKDNTFGKTKEQYAVGTTKEDWDGFKSLMEASTMTDKDLILRVLTMYTDADQRRKEIKNLSKTYTELADKVLPKLRRSEITIMVDKISRTDDQITALINTTPDSLSLEELLYGANLVNDVNTKVTVYQNAEKRFASDWRAANNLGGAYLMQNKLGEAEEAFKRADKVANGAPEVSNNMGIIEAKKGNRALAMELYKKAGGSAESKYNMGIINIRDGKYADAVSNFGDFKGHNKALAQFLSGNAASVKETIDASNEKDAAYCFYLKAVSFARQGNNAEAMTNLKTAIEKDAAWKAYAKDDCEFLKMRAELPQ
ncbi:MAG: tetratricopeptide repeat protein [Sphingobacteriaceae bacterium]|nr:tetratricopeptide repeat protein [Sphingobacteriaceae bacterium]